MTLQEKYNAIQEGSFSKAQFKTDAVKTLPKLVTTFNSYDEVVTILKNKGMITEQVKKVLTEGYSKEEAMEIARVESEGGFVQHVNRLSNGMYRAEDWYDGDNTVATYEDGELVRSYDDLDDLDESGLDYGSKQGLKTFNDLDFKKDPMFGMTAAMNFDNGWGILVSIDSLLFDDPKTYEMSLQKDGRSTYTPEFPDELSDVKWSTKDKDEVSDVMRRIQDLPPSNSSNLQEALSTQAIDDLIKKEKDSKVKNKLVKIRGKVLHKKKLSKAETDFAKEVGLLNEDTEDYFLSIDDELGWYDKEDRKYDGDFDFDYDEEEVDSYDDLMDKGIDQKWFASRRSDDDGSMYNDGRRMFDLYKDKYGKPFKLRKRIRENEESNKIVSAKKNGDASYTVKYSDGTTKTIYISNDAWDEINDKYGKVNEEGKKEYKRKVLPNKNKHTSDTISIKSALEKIIQKVWAEPDLVKGKSIVIDFLTTSRMNDDSKKTMLANIKDIKTKPRLDSYLANALLAFEKLRVPKSGSYRLRETDSSTTLSEELSKYKEEKGSVYAPAVDNPADAFSSEELNRGIDYELEAAGFDSASPETFTEEDVEKARKKAIKNLEKNRLHYLNLLAGEKDTATTYDKMVAVKKDNFVDKENEMKKANLKEAIKKIIVRSLGNTPQALTEGRVQRMWEVGRAYPGYGKALKVEGERNKVTVEFHTGKSHLFEIDSESGIWQEIKDPINESGVNANVDISLEEFDFMHGMTPVKAEKAMVMAAKLIQRSLDQELPDDPLMVKSFIVELLSKHLENRL